MSTFKDNVDSDIYNVFLDLEYFADWHYVAGKRIQCVIDDDALRARQGGEELAVAESSLMLFAKTGDLPKRQPAGQTINIDSKEYVIDDWAENMGVATLTLSQNISR